MGYLTPDTIPTDTICRVLFIPNNREFIANVTGAIETLTDAFNWYPQGALTPQQSADAMVPMFDAFCFDKGVCRVIGEFVPYAGSSSPFANWLVCDGSSLLRTDYPELFTVIGTNYGSVDSAHFNIPDLRDNALTGASLTHPIGTSYGEASHTLSVAEIPSHSHSDLGHSHAEGTATATLIAIGAGVPAPSAVPSIGVTGTGNANITSTGGGGAHNNLPPSVAINWLIVAL